MVSVAAAFPANCGDEGHVEDGSCSVCHRRVCLHLDRVRLNPVAHGQDEDWDALLVEVDRAIQSAAPAETHLQARSLLYCFEDSEGQLHHQPASLSPRSKSCELCRKPSSSLSCRSGCCKCHVCFLMPEIFYQIKCKEAGYGCVADGLTRQVEYGVANYSAHAGGGSALIPNFSAQLAALHVMRQCDDADTHMLAVLEIFMKGFGTAILTPMLPPYHFRRRLRTLCLVSYNEFTVLQILQHGCYTSGLLQATFHVVYAIFVPLGLIRRRRVRASMKSFLRFRGEDFCVLSSVMHPLNLQLNPLP